MAEIGHPFATSMIILGGSSQDGRKWLITMVIVSPQFPGLWDPFQMAIHGL